MSEFVDQVPYFFWLSRFILLQQENITTLIERFLISHGFENIRRENCTDQMNGVMVRVFFVSHGIVELSTIIIRPYGTENWMTPIVALDSKFSGPCVRGSSILPSGTRNIISLTELKIVKLFFI